MDKKSIIFAFLFLASLSLYVLTLSPDWGAINIFNTWDGLEYVLCSSLLGIDHPPGHPLYLILAKIFSSLIFIGSVAYRMNLFSAVFGAMTVAMIYLVVELALNAVRKPESVGLRHGAAILSSALFAVSRVFWTHSVITEVHTFYLFLMLILFYFSLRYLEGGARMWVYGAALTSGLMISTNILNALTAVFPVAVFFLIMGVISDRHRLKPADWLKCFALFAVGSSFYLYYFIVSRFSSGFVQPMNIIPGKPLGSLSWFSWFIGGKPWVEGGMFSFGVILRNIPNYLLQLLDSYSIPLFIGFAAAVFWTVRDAAARRVGKEARTVLFFLFCYVAVLIPQLSVTQAGSPGGSMELYTANIYLPSFLLFVLISGVGLVFVLDLIPKRSYAIAVLCLLFIFPAYLLARNYPSCQLRGEGVGYRFAKGMVAGLPDRSVVYSKLIYQLVSTYFTRVENIAGAKSFTIENPDKSSMLGHLARGDDVYLAGDCVDQDKAPEVLLMSDLVLVPRISSDVEPLIGKPYPTELVLYRVMGERRGELVRKPEIENRGLSNDGRFEGLELLGYSIPSEEKAPIGRSRMDIDLYWKPLRRFEKDLLGVFLVYTEDLRKVDPARAAAFFTLGGSYPTSNWRAGEIIKDRCFYYFPHLPPGRYYLALGVLTSPDQALPYYPAAYKENGQSYDFVMLMPFVIGRQLPAR